MQDMYQEVGGQFQGMDVMELNWSTSSKTTPTI